MKASQADKMPTQQLAGMGVRSWAFIIDLFIRIVLSLSIFAIISYFKYTSEINQLFSVNQTTETLSTQFQLIFTDPSIFFIAFSVFMLYHTLLEFLFEGQTPGKRWTHITIVDLKGNPPRFWQIVTRNIFRFIDFFPLIYGVGLFVGFIHKDQRRVGDIIAKTRLIYVD